MIIGNNVWIGGGVTVLNNVTIGGNVFVWGRAIIGTSKAILSQK
ncbi:hypothetical protein [Dyella sp.]